MANPFVLAEISKYMQDRDKGVQPVVKHGQIDDDTRARNLFPLSLVEA